ncbi:ATP-binding protein [Aquimarina sp. D1M17]|uniref:ATP-binding protein n=1 Tax=Aquimarina acroporae TaxID=2937283 RepID=UPI0020BF6565|nr:ATP-binding protein [Aquimarina acroporae]MCK8524386.1 ATP-binding protein [Aquimarina acroporae]
MKPTTQDLRNIPDFSTVPDNQLQWLIDNSDVQTFKQGEFLFKRGDATTNLSIVLEGRIVIKLERNGNFKLVGEIVKNGITGLLPFSRMSSAAGYGEVTQDAKILFLEKSFFREMVAMHYELTESLVHKMTSRVREFTKNNVQSEKMMALGKLSAGLAHELNNPASAMVSSAKALKKHLSHVPEKFKRVTSLRITGEQVDIINDILFSSIANRSGNTMKLTERAEKEDELEKWLEDHGLDNAFELTETLIDFCVDVPALQKIYDTTGDENFASAVEWIENVLTTEKIVDEISEASDRIAKLVQSVKSYTHMDRAQEKVAADIHSGIESTLVMLKHKLKKKNIEVEQQFAIDLPHPKIFVSEINQVWTNLIDNAVDAMEPSGILQISTNRDKSFVKIDVTDNGKGIPEEDIGSIFDPFFTTKSIGEGTGIGLEVVQRIINQHNGDIKVTSKPGKTTFTVCLPIN